LKVGGIKPGLTLLLLLVLMVALTGCFQDKSVTNKSSDLYWIEDKSGALTLNDIRKKDLSTQWTKAERSNPNFGFTKSAFWLSLPIENKEFTQTPMLLEIAFPLHDSIDVFFLDGGEVVSRFQSGDLLPFSERPLNHRNFLFPLTVPPKRKLQAILRVQSTDTMYIPIAVWESNEFFTRDQQEVLFLGLFFGFLSIMLIYNLLLYTSTRQKSYLYYSLCTASIIYMQLTQKNLGFQYFWPESMFFNCMSVPISSFITISASSLFMLKLLDLDEKQYSKTVASFKAFIYLGLFGLALGLIALITESTIIPYLAFIIASAGIGGVATIVVMGMLVNLSLKGNRSAQILSVAWFSLLVGSLLFVLGRVGVPLPMMLAENAMLIGATFEAALISFALARHIKDEREARILAQELALNNEREAHEAQNSLLKLQEKTTQQLEEEVKERTQKLEVAMKSLTIANHKLDSLSRLDSLTGLSNRRNFDQEFNEEWLVCSQQEQPMSLLMADIDHFKNINDTYGHIFGDQCLIKVAEILKSCVYQPKHLAARFGGEEFIIMLPNTDAKAAGLIAELIRFEIEKLRLSFQGQQVFFTISIGVSTIIPSANTCFIDLNENADKGLYLAKEGGRNRVVVSDGSTSKVVEQASAISADV